MDSVGSRYGQITVSFNNNEPSDAIKEVISEWLRNY
jgi:hypothetical protein